MIDFEVPENISQKVQAVSEIARNVMRPISRYWDEREHEVPWDYIHTMWENSKAHTAEILARAEMRAAGADTTDAASLVKQVIVSEIEAWGDIGLTMTIPGPGLGGVAVQAIGTLAQQRRFLTPFTQGAPKWGAMAMTESGAGSDTAAIQTAARRDGDHWVLNGEKIFCSCGLLAGQQPGGFIVIWAIADGIAGRVGMKPFVVEAGTPGMTIAKVEDKLGLHVNDTAAIVLDECRIPLDNLLGSPEPLDPGQGKGFGGAMATFDASRPVVAAGAVGIGRAALELTREALGPAGIEVPYGLPRQKLTAVQRDLLEMESQLRAAWLLTLRAAWLADERRANNLEASMSKVKAGRAVTLITQKAVELLGPLGYSRALLVEKTMREAKIFDIFEGTGQINMLIVARRILGYSRRELK